MKFVEAERIGSMQAVQDMAATVSAVYQAALKHDGMPSDTKFALFTPDNPFVPFYERAIIQFREMMTDCTNHGYVGLSIGSREVYKRKKSRKS